MFVCNQILRLISRSWNLATSIDLKFGINITINFTGSDILVVQPGMSAQEGTLQRLIVLIYPLITTNVVWLTIQLQSIKSTVDIIIVQFF